MKLSGLSIIGQSRAERVGQPHAAANPANGETIAPDFYWATAKDIESAARLATRAFMKYRRWPGKSRESFLKRIAELLEANAAEIVGRAHLETALPEARLQGELARTCFQLRLCGSAAASGLCAGARIDHADPERKPLPKPDLRSMMTPIGPVAVFSASNFPLAFSVAGGDTAAALAAGCPVIVKPHHGHLGTSELVGLLVQQAARECGAPEGVFSMLFGDGRDLGIALVKHPAIKAVGFTGSQTAGRVLMDAAASRPEPIPVYAEMGSINPVFMFAHVLERSAEELAAGLHGSVTLGVGQFCTNPGLVFIESGKGVERFLAKLGDLISATPPGTMLTSGLCAAYRSSVERVCAIGGVKRLAQTSENSEKGEAQAGAALFVTDAATFLNTPGLMEEMFGPSTLVVECESREQMFSAAERIEGQLTATVHALPDELDSNSNLVELLSVRAGRLLFGGFPTGVEVAHAMTHGGPYPATSDGRSTSVGTRAIERFLRPLTYQNFPDASLPPELQESNPLKITRLVDGKWC